MRQQLGAAAVNPGDTTVFSVAPRVLLQSALPFVNGPSGYMQNNGVVVIGQRPASSATATFSATSGAGVTCTFSAATLAGSASDVGRVLTILDTTYKYFTVTGNSGSSTTVCQGTISGGTLSTVGAWANSAIWLSNNVTGSIASYGTPFLRVIGNCYSYFPANAISSGSAAGWYWANYVSSTVGTVYNNTYSSGIPAVVGSPTAFSTTGPGAYAGATGGITGRNVAMPGNSMGKNGSVELKVFFSGNNNANNKTWQCTPGLGFLGVQSALVSGGFFSWTNQGVTNQQVYCSGDGYQIGELRAQTANSAGITATDTTANVTISEQTNKATATDWMICERLSMILIPSF